MKRILSLIITVLALSLIPITVLAQNADELNAEALELISSERYNAALEVFDKLNRDYPNYFIGWYNKASAHALLGRKEDAIQQKEDAIQAVKKALELKPDFAEAWYLCGQLLSSGELAIELAIQCFDKAISSPNYVPGEVYLSLAWFNKGIAIYEYYKDDKKKYDEVIKCIDNGLGGIFNAPNIVLTTKAFLLFEMGRYVDAITAAESAIEADKRKEPLSQGGLYNVIGLCHYKRGEIQGALDAYVEAINWLEQATSPFAKLLLAGAWNNAGILYHIAGQYDDAIMCYDKALSIDDNPAAIQNSGFILSNKGYALFCRAKEEERLGIIEDARRDNQKAFEVPAGSPPDGLRREDLDKLYTDETISLIRLGYPKLEGIFFIENVEQEGTNYPFFDYKELYMPPWGIYHSREKIEDSKPISLPSPIEATTGTYKSLFPESKPLSIEEIEKIVREYRDGGSWALVIGVYGYNPERNGDGIKEDIQFTRIDAEQTKNFLEETARFDHVIYLDGENATKEKIEEKLNTLKRRAGSNDRVIIYYSGHGHRYQQGGKEYFYLVPFDGIISGNSAPQHCISMYSLGETAREMTAKHVLVILDCCYSGGIKFKGPQRLTRQQLIMRTVAKLSGIEGREALTAGRDDEQAIGDVNGSLFTKHLLDGLKGDADEHGHQDGIITIAELWSYVLDNVLNDPGAQQTPQYIPLSPPSKAGHFFYITPQALRQLQNR